MPDAVTAAPPIRSLVWSLLGALVALWLGYAIVAGMKQGSAAAQPAPHPQPAAATAPVGLALTAAPALRVRSSLFGPARAGIVIRHAPRQRLASAGCRRQAAGSHRSARTGRVAVDGSLHGWSCSGGGCSE